MALVQMAGGFNAIIGKVNGGVFQRSGSLVMLRTNRNFNRPAASAWQNQKAVLAQVAQTWRTLSDADRAAWAAIVGDYPTTDPFGNPRIPSAYELFMTLNTPLVSIAFPIISPPAAPAILTNIGAVGVNNGGALNVIATWGVAVTADERITIYGHAPQSTGRGLASGGFVLIGLADMGYGTSGDFTLGYQFYFGAVQSGQKIYLRFQVINTLTGQKGTVKHAYMIVP